ncbi:MAG: serine hydrolase [Lachnospiraceae bacterium]|nr:serine hydrolase [Lachnospiraceae bacterium]
MTLMRIFLSRTVTAATSIVALALLFTFFITPSLIAFATLDQNREAAEARKLLPIESNQIDDWPSGPAIGAAAAILYEVNTGVILYAKDIHGKQYPASTTKLMTCLMAIENASLNDIVPFSRTAVTSISWDSANIGISAGQSLSMEHALYAQMVASANEVSNGIAEFVGGDMETFAQMMTDRAAELGARSTNFINAHGLSDEEHYTTAYDMALIAAAFFRNEMLAKIGNTVTYTIPATETQPNEIFMRNRHRLIIGEFETEYTIVGGKTGYTNLSRQTLVTCAEMDGMRLVCVIFKQESPDQFHDTVTLFDYGFSNFQIVNVADNETRYTIENAGFFHTGNDIFGDSSPFLSLNRSDHLVMPRYADFDDLATEISYQTDRRAAVAEITYRYNDVFLGMATIDYATPNRSTFDFDHNMPVIEEEVAPVIEENVVFINVRQAVFLIVGIALAVILFFFIRTAIKDYRYNRRYRKKRRKKPTRRKRRDRFKGYYL